MTDPNAETAPAISGYSYGTRESARSPLSEDDLRRLEQAVGWNSDDAETLREHEGLFRQRTERMVESWRSVIASQPHLDSVFLGTGGTPDEDYKARVKQRFIQWVVDAVSRPHDRAWLDYQEEIGLRHTPAKKNVTDGAHAAPLVPLRYLVGFLPVVFSIRSFFEDVVESQSELDRLEASWRKSVVLHVTLWVRPYTQEGFW